MWLLFALFSTLSLAIVSILNSIFVHNYIKSPLAITWIQSCISLAFLFIVGPFFDLSSTWVTTLVLIGITAYAGDLCFFYVIDKFDISVQNSSWAILSLLLSIAGFIFFHESWTIFQSLGAAFIVGGTLLLSLYHQHINIWRTFGLFLASSILYVPYYVVMKAALDDGQSIASVLFWLFIGREFFSIMTPLLSPQTFHDNFKNVRLQTFFIVISIITVIIYFIAQYAEALALETGPISLVALVINVQPFLVMGIARICTTLWPTNAPKELLTRQSIKIKLSTFILVFVGLALIGIYQ